MADKREIQILISAKDQAKNTLDKVGAAVSSVGKFATKASLAMGAVGAAATAGMKIATDASNELNNALIGLNSVAAAFKQDTDAAKKAAIELASDGLMSVKSAADSLKNLLGAGFNLDEATKLMYGFKDAAAFNRQGTLEFGQAIEGATQGIKNQNSIMVDNAGITKNLSVILTEAGYSAQDLGKVTSDNNVRMALYNGILKEAATFQGDAARMADTLSGKQAALATKIFTVKAAIGDALAPIMSKIIDSADILIDRLGGSEGLKSKFEVVTKYVLLSMDAFTKIKDSIVALYSPVLQILSNALDNITGKFREIKNEVDRLGGLVVALREKKEELFAFLDGKLLGALTILKNSFENIFLVFQDRLLPELIRLWEIVQPLAPFFLTLAKIIGIILYGALIAVVKILEFSLIVAMEYLTILIKGANIVIKTFVDYWTTAIGVLKEVWNWITKVIEKIDKLNLIGGVSSAVGGFLGFGGARAAGGPVRAGGNYLVGENGPELFSPNTSGKIIPNGRMGGNTIINVTVNGDVSGQELIDKVADGLMGKLSLQGRIAL